MISMQSRQVMALEARHFQPCFTRKPLAVARGKGSRVYDLEGKAYLDFIGSLGTCVVGHGNPVVLQAVKAQLGKIVSTSNLYYSEPQALLAKRLARVSGLGKSFFSNSGSESVEAALKLARKASGKKGIIATEHAFHGRTLGALSATSKEKYKDYCRHLVPGFKEIPFNDARALEKAIGADTAAFLVEPIQGEAGVLVPSEGYLQEVREICAKRDVLLILDEVQSGVARTGKFFAYQHEKILPDIVCTAKGLGNGFPIGATIAAAGIEFGKGDHGSTFGGNPLACAAALAVLDCIQEQGLEARAAEKGAWLAKALNAVMGPDSALQVVRGRGLMLGLGVQGGKADAVVDACRAQGLLVNGVGDDTIRLLPPLTVSLKECRQAVAVLEEALAV